MLSSYLEILQKALSSIKDINKASTFGDYVSSVFSGFTLLIIGLVTVIVVCAIVALPTYIIYRPVKQVNQLSDEYCKLYRVYNLMSHYIRNRGDIGQLSPKEFKLIISMSSLREDILASEIAENKNNELGILEKDLDRISKEVDSIESTIKKTKYKIAIYSIITFLVFTPIILPLILIICDIVGKVIIFAVLATVVGVAYLVLSSRI